MAESGFAPAAVSEMTLFQIKLVRPATAAARTMPSFDSIDAAAKYVEG